MFAFPVHTWCWSPSAQQRQKKKKRLILVQVQKYIKHQKECDLAFRHNAAGEGDRAALPTGVLRAAVEVHVVGPVGERSSTAAVKLWGHKHSRWRCCQVSVKTSIGQRGTVQYGIGSNLYLSLPKVNKVLQVNVISVVGDGVVNDFSHFISSLDRSKNKDNLIIWKTTSIPSYFHGLIRHWDIKDVFFFFTFVNSMNVPQEGSVLTVRQTKKKKKHKMRPQNSTSNPQSNC